MWRRPDGVASVGSRLPPPPWLAAAPTVREVEVELVEDVEPAVPAAPSGGRGGVRERTTPPRARARRRALLVATAGVLVAAVVVPLNVATEARSSAAAARLAAVPGVLDPVVVPGPPWSRDGVVLLGVVDDVVLVASAGHRVEGLDARTGAVRWAEEEQGTAGWCALVPTDHEGVVQERTTPWRPDPSSLVCHRTGWWTDDPDDAVRRRVLVQVLEPTSGRSAAAVQEDGRLVLTLQLQGDLVVVVARDDGAVVAHRWHPASGTRWRTVSEPGVATPDAAGTAVLQDGRTLTVRGDGRVTFALADGGELPSHVPALARRRTGTRPPSPVVTDAVAPLALVHRSDGTRVVVPGPGRAVRELWRLPAGPRPEPVVDVAGVLVVARTAEVVAHDRASGREVWRTRTAAGVQPAPLTDGEVVLVPVPGRGTTDLAAVRLDDGGQEWRVALPRGA
ncbi:MAG: PQQ-binding-like beta-propeller repeat protein, partial [Actinotalea sp.]|nr:PQQ-binding-like beta-propeller repeat protein [Actinotalea sp.]